VVFYVSPKLAKDVSTITLSYTFFEVGASVPTAAITPQVIGGGV
jgi:cytochrome c oxidase assembly protein subunit 11